MSTRTIRAALAGTLAAFCTVALALAGTPATASPATPSPATAAAHRAAAHRAAAHKATAVYLLDQLFNHHNLAVIDQIILPTYIQHDPLAPDGTQALKDFVTSAETAFPNLHISIKRVLAAGDLVVVHSNVVLQPGTKGSAVVDIYRYAGDKIAEHWDVIQAVPDTTASGNDMFATLSPPRLPGPDPWAPTGVTRRVATALFTRLFSERDVTALDRYIAGPYYQHNPLAPNGVAFARQLFASVFASHPDFSVSTKRIIADGDFVAFHSLYKLTADDPGTVVVDLYRVRDHKVVEHWDVSQPFPTTSANPHPMF